MSDFPRNRHEMVRMGYRKTGDGACKGCSAPIEWWTTKKGKSIPVNPAPNDYAPTEAHFATCPNAKEFKGAPAGPATPQPPTREVFSREVRALRDRYDARVVVYIDDFGTHASWRNDIPGEDLRHDLISAANHIRNSIAHQEESK